MTVDDLLKRIPKEDYHKVIVISDGESWANVSGKITIDESTITLTDDSDDNPLFYQN